MDLNSTSLIADYLSERKQRVKLNGLSSTWNTLEKGVPQGSIMGPTLFNLFTNDIFFDIKDGVLFNYADDNTILVSASDKDTVLDKLQRNANDVVQWCNNNQMEANASKFQVMISNDVDSKVKIGDVEITSEKSVKLLGVHLDNDFSFNEHIANLSRKATRQLNCLKRVAFALPTDIKLLLYKSFVLSNFCYCPAVWHHCGKRNTELLERIQYRALKFVFKDYDAPYQELLSRANLPSLELGHLQKIAVEV